MDNNEKQVSIAQIEATTQRWSIVGATIRLFVTASSVVAAIYFIVRGLPPILMGKDAADIDAVARLFGDLKIYTWMSMLGNVAFYGAWRVEKTRRSRLEQKANRK